MELISKGVDIFAVAMGHKMVFYGLTSLSIIIRKGVGIYGEDNNQELD